jgi:FlaG/FlaF family flagellin (archaellin)
MRSDRNAAPDDAVSPVVATILLVAVTVGLSATLLLADGWRPSSPSYADVATRGEDLDDNHDIDTIAIKLQAAPSAPVDAQVQISTEAIDHSTDVERWHVGATQRFPCLGPGPHHLAITVDGDTTATVRLTCDETPHVPNATGGEDTTDDATTSTTPYRQQDTCDRTILEEILADQDVIDRLHRLCQLTP